MKALEMLRARKNNSVTTVTSEKNAVVTAQPLINKAVTSVTAVTSNLRNAESDFEDFDDDVIVKNCIECNFFHPDDKHSPYQGLGRCELGIIRKDRPLHPMQDACDKSKPLTPF